MKTKLKNNLLLLLLFLFFGCQRKHFPVVAEMKKRNNIFKTVNHQTGLFLFSINPISYKKDDKEIFIKGIVSYPGYDSYSQGFDTLKKGFGSTVIYYGNINYFGKIKAKKIGTTDCNGLFEIKFKRELNSYLILSHPNLNSTGYNSLSYFAKYDSVYCDKIFIETPCK